MAVIVFSLLLIKEASYPLVIFFLSYLDANLLDELKIGDRRKFEDFKKTDILWLVTSERDVWIMKRLRDLLWKLFRWKDFEPYLQYFSGGRRSGDWMMVDLQWFETFTFNNRFQINDGIFNIFILKFIFIQLREVNIYNHILILMTERLRHLFL